MDKRRIAGMAFLYLHGGLPPNINVITRDAREIWDNKIHLSHMPLSYMYHQGEPDYKKIVHADQDEIELDVFLIEGLKIMAGFSDRFYTLVLSGVRDQ